jgi:SSS family solute:Na+ symporter
VTAAIFVGVYLLAVLYIGIFAFRRSAHQGAEGFFLAGRSIGGFVFLFSLFGTHMTAFAILGSSGHAFSNGIVTYGLMASSSALIVPLLLLTLGTRLWSAGRRFGHFTPVQIFRDRWECNHTGTLIFVLQAALLLPYILIGMIGGGTVLRTLSGGAIPYWAGSALVAIVIMSYVIFGGMRGTAWVNTFQTLLFLSFGAIAVVVIGRGMGGFEQAMQTMLSDPALAPLLTRERIPPAVFFSYTFMPLSAIAFPHISIFCMTAKKMSQFKRTVILYPVCILLIWLPCVFLGVAANSAKDIPQLRDKQEARALLATAAANMTPAELQQTRARASGDDVLVVLLNRYAPVWLAGLLGAGIMAAVMASDSQILALSTMFTEDIFAWYGHAGRYGEQAQILTGRVFIFAVTALAYLIALRVPAGIFELAGQYAFAGFSALVPLFVGALYWRGSSKHGALACTLWVLAAVAGIAWFQAATPAPQGPPATYFSLGGVPLLQRTATGTAVAGYLPVLPMTVISGILMFLVSLATPKPSAATVERYFPRC